jgi:hypothetical protein
MQAPGSAIVSSPAVRAIGVIPDRGVRLMPARRVCGHHADARADTTAFGIGWHRCDSVIPWSEG